MEFKRVSLTRWNVYDDVSCICGKPKLLGYIYYHKYTDEFCFQCAIYKIGRSPVSFGINSYNFDLINKKIKELKEDMVLRDVFKCSRRY